MSEPEILRAMSRLRPTDHLCWLYADEAEKQAALSACQRAAAHRHALLRTIGAHVDQPQPAEAPQAIGPGAEQDTWAQIRVLLSQAAQTSPPPWLIADLSPVACEAATGYYARLQEVWAEVASASLQLIELYDTRQVAPEVLFGLLRSHNLTVWEGNLYFNEMASMPPGGCEAIRDPRQRIARFMANLKPWSQTRSELERRLEELGAFQAIARAINLSLSLEEILQATLDQIIALVRADAGYLSLRHPSGQGLLSFVLRGASPQLAELFADQELVARLDSKIGAHDEPVLVADLHFSPTRKLVPTPVLEEGYTSLLFTALRSRAKVQGAIVLAAREARRFGPGEAALLKSLSEQVGVALDNACLYAEARQRAEEMRSLYDLSLAAASLDPEDILRLIGERIMRLFRAACFFVALVDEEKGLLHFAHLIDQDQVLTPFSVPIGEEGGLTAYVLNAGQPLLIADLAAEADSLPVQPIHFGEAARSWLGVPMVVKGRAIGVMSVQAYVPAAFDEDDQRLLSMAAQQAASALENARLFQETLALEKNYHALLEQLNDGYAVFQDGRLVFANARLGDMLGLAPEALLASSLEELLAHEERRNGALPAIPHEPGSEPIRYRTQFQKSDGSALPVEVTLHWIEYEGRPALAVLCRDISSQVRLEAQLIQAEKLSAVGQLVSGVAHELNNPLTTIKGYAQLMRGEPLPPTVIEDLRRVEEAADRCRRIVWDLLTFARRYEPEFVDTDVNELLQRTAALRSYELRVHNITVQWDLDPTLPFIKADPHRLQQVVLNLIFNAEQALLSAGERGAITIRSCTLPGSQGIRFEVADNGPGIRPEHLDRIFDPFFTTKEVGAGTGLGLSISYGIVKEHGGRIWAESRLGQGATFLVELPLVVQQGNAADPSERADRGQER